MVVRPPPSDAGPNRRETRADAAGIVDHLDGCTPNPLLTVVAGCIVRTGMITQRHEIDRSKTTICSLCLGEPRCSVRSPLRPGPPVLEPRTVPVSARRDDQPSRRVDSAGFCTTRPRPTRGTFLARPGRPTAAIAVSPTMHTTGPLAPAATWLPRTGATNDLAVGRPPPISGG